MKRIGVLELHNSKEIAENFMSIGFECADRDMFKVEECYDYLGQSGIKYARLSSGWAKTEKVPGIFDFGWLDSIVNELIERGIEPWFNVVYGNPIYMPDAPNETAAGCTPMRYGEEVMQKWLSYVEALAKHFAGRVTHYEIWNEANSSWFWYPGKPDMVEYAEFIRRSGQMIKKVLQDARIGCGLDGRGFMDDQWLNVLLSELHPGDIDFYCFHTYTTAPEFQYFPNVRRIRERLDSFGHERTEIWQGEAGFPTWFPEDLKHGMKPESQSNEQRQAIVFLRRYFLDKASGCVRSSVYHTCDLWEKAYRLPGLVEKRQAAFGILNGLTYTPKKAYEVMCRMATIFSGKFVCISHSTPCNEAERKGAAVEPVRFVYEKDGKPVYAYYLPTDVEKEEAIDGNYTFYITANENKRWLSHPVLIDMLEGTVYELESQKDAAGNQKFEKLPLASYPFVICDRDTYKII